MVQKRIHIFVTGRVQGVFFRQSTRVMAIKNNVNGWVRNLDDGRVEIIAEGEKQNIDNLVKDIYEVINAIRMRPTHKNIMLPGIGVGGYCLTKDPLLA